MKLRVKQHAHYTQELDESLARLGKVHEMLDDTAKKKR